MSRPDELDFAIRAKTNVDTAARIDARRAAIIAIIDKHHFLLGFGKCNCGLKCYSWAAHVEELLREFTEPQ